MNILLTFTGFHDPYSESSIAGRLENGPVLTVVKERHFDFVYIFSTPVTTEISNRTKEQIEKDAGHATVELVDIPLKDPTNYLGILKQLRIKFKWIRKKHKDPNYYICVSSGTPHMHASWLMLAASGEIPARILQTRALKFVREGEKQVSEIDFTNPSFPEIKPFGSIADQPETDGFSAICAQMAIIGDDDRFLHALQTAFKLAAYDSHIMVLGETGVGKEVFAHLIHQASRRCGKELVSLNCAGLSDQLVDSQLFGHKRGAFTGADRDHAGYFETANGGTLFLDEIGEMPVNSQAKLLRALEAGKIQRLGESRERSVNVRVVAATNLDVAQAIKERKFRKDLFYRFQSPITIPPLRERSSDIPRLAQHFLEEWNKRYREQKRLAVESIGKLRQHPWPGNIRELKRTVEGSAQLCSGKVVKAEDIKFDDQWTVDGLESLPQPHPGFDINEYLSEVRIQLISRAVEISDGNKSKAAGLLGLTPQAVSQYLLSKRNES